MRDREKYEQRVGTVVDGKWRVEALLGWGATAAVYAATHRNGHRAALKILHASLCSDTSAIDRFLGEAAAANKIRHRAIVPVNDDGRTEDGCTYLVLDLHVGDSLAEMRAKKSGRIELEDVAPIAEELMSALAAVHAAGVVHRDLKPSNILLTPKGELKLLDFGTAGLVAGAAAFVSPEQAQGQDVDAQSDVWSLGATLFTLLCGEYVHPGRDARARMHAAATLPARKLGEVAPSLDDRVALVIDRALFQHKSERWPDVQSMRIAFRHAVVTAVPTMRDLAVFANTMEQVDEEAEAAAGSVSVSDPSIAIAEVALLSPGERGGIATPLALASRIPPAERAPSLRPLARESDFELGVASTRRDLTPIPKGIPPIALLVGGAAMAAVIVLVVFFQAGGDASTGRTSAAGDTESPAGKTDTTSSKVEAPAPDFIVIEAPDDPAAIAAAKKKTELPAWATAPRPKVDAGPNATASAADAEAPAAAATTDAAAPEPLATPPEPAAAEPE